MKCQQCSTDAPAETDPDSGRLRCSKCHAFFGTGTTQTAAVQQARDILRKWSSADLLDQISSFPQVPPLQERQDPSSYPGSPPAHPASTASDSAGDESSQTTDEQPSSRPLPDAGDPDRPSAEILSLDGTPHDSVSPPADDESVTQEPKPADPAADVRPLSILRPDDAVDSTDLDAAESHAPPPPSSDTETSDAKRERTSRRLVRPPVVRRRSRPTAAAPAESGQPAATAQQGMDAVKKNLRVDRPAAHAPVGHLTSPQEDTASVDPRAQDASNARRFRIDSAEDLQALSDASGRVRSQSRPRQRFVDEAHEAASLRGPHFQVDAPRRSSLTSLTGQFLAYIGVLGLTIGTAIVIYGHFGGMSEYTPTGWLVTTVAQMLLFLGIINLVSGGIEQNNDDVSRRINVLGEQLMRLEQVTESAMRGPRIPAERYAAGPVSEEAAEHESAYVDQR